MKCTSFTTGMVVVSLLFSGACHKHDGPTPSQPPPSTWSRKVTLTGNSWFQSVGKTPDGGYIAAGETGVENSDVLVVKVDEAGNQQWAHNYGGSLNDFLSSIIVTADGGYLLSGSTLSTDGDFANTHLHSQGNRDIFLMKLKSNGDMSWVKTYGGTGLNVVAPHATIQTADGGFELAGSASVHDGDFANAIRKEGEDPNFFILRTDGSGNISWIRLVGGSGTGFVSMIRPTADGGTILAGQYDGPADQDFAGATAHGYADNYVMKLDASYHVSWAKLYGDLYEDLVYDAVPTSDGGVVLTGLEGMGDINVRKVSGTGELQWNTTLGGSEVDYGYSIIQLSCGGYAVCGFSSSTDGCFAGIAGHGGTDAFVMTLDNGGQHPSIQLLGDAGTDHASDLVAAPDGNIVFAGSTQPALDGSAGTPMSAWISKIATGYHGLP